MDILLTTFNARWAHCAFGLRYLLANLGDLRPRAEIVEFDISQRPVDVLESILSGGPKIVGVGVYIWNVAQATQLVAGLKRLRPEIVVVLGGPEVSYETDQQEITQYADYVISGEGDLAFAELCRDVLAGRRPTDKVIHAPPPTFDRLELPYDLYDQCDIDQRVIYVEASRGCPFSCEFCLSSIDSPVRNVPLEKFLGEMRKLLDRGVRQFKFVDRTFNLNLGIGRRILEFFHQRIRPGMFMHFEMIPDRLPRELREMIVQFPPGALQLEVGIQSFNPAVAELISRRQDNAKVEENLRFLRQETGVHVHADLIAGLPGEDLPSFAAGFDRLVSLGPQEIQVGILKRLRGTPIVRHDQEWRMIYSPHPPYEVLQTKLIDFATMQRLRRFARYWDLMANSGNFLTTLPLLWTGKHGPSSPFAAFMALSDWLHEQGGRTHGIALDALVELIFKYLTQRTGHEAVPVAQHLWHDWQHAGRRDPPACLRPHLPALPPRREVVRPSAPPRQARHLM